MFNNTTMFGAGQTINTNTLNDFQRNQSQSYGYSTGSNAARLLLFSPQKIPYQVTKPFTYQFTPDFLDTVKSGVSLAHAVGPMGPENECIMKAILPAADGMVLNTSTLENMWSFVLIIDSGAEHVGTIVKPGVRKVAMGYLTDEPGTTDMGGNFILNPNAFLIFTHCSTLFIKRSAGPMTPADGLTVYNSQDVDYANETTAMLYNDKILLGTPQDIMQMSQDQQTNTTGIIDYSAIDLGYVKQGSSDTRMIDNSIKAPRHQLSDIMSAIDNGIDYTQAEEPIMNRFVNQDDLYTAPNERAIQTSIRNMPSGTGIMLNTGLDTTRPTSIGELSAMFPNIEVHPFRIGVNQGWDSNSQAMMNNSGKVSPIMSIRNQLSFLTSSVTQAICSQLGIAQAAYSYMSLDGDGFTPGHREAFELKSFDLIVPRPDPVIKDAAMRFKQYLDDQLFDIIRALAGEYEVHVLANMGGDILINLKLYNFPDPEDGTYFQTSARFGGLMNPMLGNIETINNNVLQLSNATQALVGNAFTEVNMTSNSMLMSDEGMMPSMMSTPMPAMPEQILVP